MKHQIAKTSYHPYILIAFYLKCLPEHILQSIPRSTKYDWQHRDIQNYFGYDWYIENKDVFHTLEMVAINKSLLRINRALLRIIALKRFIIKHKDAIKAGRLIVKAVLVNHIVKVSGVIGFRKTLKYLDINSQQYANLKRNLRCPSSFYDLCKIKHPSQLLAKEIIAIKTYCLQSKYQFWSLCSVYHQMRRDGTAHMNLSTFYKYISHLNLKRSRAFSRRKNHSVGIRATAPFQILHADLTEFKTEDNRKAYIYLVQDNYSRAILTYQLSPERRAAYTLQNLLKVKTEYLLPANINECMLLTDDGSENYGEAKKWMSACEHPTINHVIAQTDIQYSNSMIEAANKQLKYRFLYHHKISDFSKLEDYLKKAIHDFNNRPHGVLNGLTPIEVLEGKTINQESLNNLLTLAKQSRIKENQQMKCCGGSF